MQTVRTERLPIAHVRIKCPAATRKRVCGQPSCRRPARRPRLVALAGVAAGAIFMRDVLPIEKVLFCTNRLHRFPYESLPIGLHERRPKAGIRPIERYDQQSSLKSPRPF